MNCWYWKGYDKALHINGATHIMRGYWKAYDKALYINGATHIMRRYWKVYDKALHINGVTPIMRGTGRHMTRHCTSMGLLI